MAKNTESGSFRDRQGTIDEKGKRVYIFAKKPKGKLYNIRSLVALVLLGFYLGAPFIMVNGEPLMLLNIFKREFILFGVKFWPHDLHLFALMMISMIVFIILFTVVYGRLWCGWACPQTIFMEMVFRRIEYLIDGDSQAQRKLKQGGWTFNKIWRRLLKYLIFIIIAFILVNALMAWVVGKDSLFRIYADGLTRHPLALAVIAFLTAVFMFIYTWFREQICIIACPYGRLQGVFLDRDSVNVAYDYKRGEPRAGLKKGEDRTAEGKGDCIDCFSCVRVCPTGIDIRHGTQMECVNCTACIDACNPIMDKIGKPRGLIRYASESSIAEGRKFRPKAKTIAYSLVLLALISVLIFLFSRRNDVEAVVVRPSGTLYQERPDGTVSNMYNVKIVNKIRKDLPIEFRLLDHEGRIEIVGGSLTAVKQDITQGVFFIVLPPRTFSSEKNILKIGVYSEGRLIDEAKTSFVAPRTGSK
jgi:cytochrome c oxidase accessory protein FixG